ncbi:MAG: hypothetical protein JKX94_06170 [Sneathiella sp.]|nr:hypothetical protein [Sneathiella sp.]
MNVWQLLGQGSVGSQSLTGLARLFKFSKRQDLNKKVQFWPFDTGWDRNLQGIVLAEVWPSLNEFETIDHPIKDARQVTACLNWLSQKNKNGTIQELFSAPQSVTPGERINCLTEEGWILGVD